MHYLKPGNPWLTLLLTLFLSAPMALSAKEDNRSDRDRVSFYGRVEAMPAGQHGAWVIGNTEVTTDGGTEFDQDDGPLAVGSCVKVEIRGGRVHEIDSEPESRCR